VRVIVVEDQLLTREGLVRTLSQVGCEVVACLSDTEGLLRSLALDVPDAVILDVRLPPTYTDEGVRAARDLRRLHPGVGVLVLSAYVEEAYALELFAGGADGLGYLLKDRILDPEMLADGLRRVAAGQTVLDPSLVTDLLRRPARPQVLDGLTTREVEVLGGIAEGLTNAAIGQRMFISSRTVEIYAQRDFAKLGLVEDAGTNRRVMAAVRYLSESSAP
jgi:DNA-binding NarL/FixJ family response regulator